MFIAYTLGNNLRGFVDTPFKQNFHFCKIWQVTSLDLLICTLKSREPAKRRSGVGSKIRSYDLLNWKSMQLMDIQANCALTFGMK